MLTRFLAAALELAVADVASIEDIDQAWMTVMQSTHGPFGIMDGVGLDTVANILKFGVESGASEFPLPPGPGLAATKNRPRPFGAKNRPRLLQLFPAQTSPRKKEGSQLQLPCLRFDFRLKSYGCS